MGYDKVIVHGKVYTLANIKELPADCDPAEAFEWESDILMSFLGMHSLYSNFHPSVFKVNGETFYNSEQYI